MLYSGVLTAVFALAVATSAGADTRPGKAVFDEIDVKRINVREDDGTIRMIVSNTSRSEEHTSELQSLMRISYDVFCLKKKNTIRITRLQYAMTNHIHKK